jgi:hypothetical protein
MLLELILLREKWNFLLHNEVNRFSPKKYPLATIGRRKSPKKTKKG